MGTGQKEKDRPPGVMSIGGDQNVMAGNVSSGGIDIQGKNARVSDQQTSGVTADEISTLFHKLYQYIETRSPDPNVDQEEIIETVQEVQEEVSKEGEPIEIKPAHRTNNLVLFLPQSF